MLSSYNHQRQCPTEKSFFIFVDGWHILKRGEAKRFDKMGRVFTPTEIESGEERLWKRN